MNTSDKGNDKDKAGASERPVSLAEASARIFAEQAASMAAMTAFGMSLTSRMTGIFMGAVADAIEKTAEDKAVAANPVERMARAPVQAGGAKSSPAAPVIKVADVARTHEKQPAKPVANKAAPVAEPVVEAPAAKTQLAKPAKPDGKVVQLRPTAKKQTVKAKVAAKAEPAKEVVTAKKAAPAKAAKPARKTVAKAEVAAVTQPAKAAAPAKSAAVAKAKAGDDLKQIPGIGPRLEKTLNDMGVLRLKQIAAWKAVDIQKFDSELGLDGRITRDDWVGQARAILKGSAD